MKEVKGREKTNEVKTVGRTGIGETDLGEGEVEGGREDLSLHTSYIHHWHVCIRKRVYTNIGD